ncbi:MAG TPA: hypothetical protein VMB78_01070 [Dissulfurispiraceae bacterium]|nr:hypothetical protein [Dissulfurispiraceae bacterium]
MKTPGYTDIVCRRFCRYYKKGKDELECGGYKFLVDNFTLSELHLMTDLLDSPDTLKDQIPAENEDLFSLVCEVCDFRIDGCDYREDRSGPPCGGFILVTNLVKI